MSPLKRFFALLRPERKDIFQIYFYALFSGLIYLILPLGIQAITSFIMTGQLSTSWTILVLVVVLAIVFSGLIQVFQLSITETLQQRIFVRAAFEFSYRVVRFKKEALKGKYAPELMNRFFDVVQIQKGLSKILIDISSSTLQIIFGLILLAFYHPLFIALGLVLLGVLAAIFRILGPNGLKTSLKESGHKYEVVQWLQELARTSDTFKLAGKTNLPLEKTDEHVSGYIEARKKHFKVLLWQYATIILFKTIITGGLLIAGSILVIEKQLTIGQFIAAEILIVMVMQSAEKLVLTLESVYDVITAVEKIGLVTDIPMEDISGKEFSPVEKDKGLRLELRRLTFKYPGVQEPIIRELSLEVNAGEKICIAGGHHSGKSTLIQLCAGLFHSYEGNILYNEIPLSNLQPESLRCYIGDSLSQEDIFIGTIMENITMGKKSIGMEQVLEIAKPVGLHDFIIQLPQGYETKVLPGGKALPKSIVRKIILCRSLVDNPRLLLLEDILLHVDKEERERIFNVLFDKNKSRTVLVVSNDKKIASMCDRFVILDEGKISAEGRSADVDHYPNLFS
ncbi:MAG: ATP-binding cassette domain-containing protein [Flavobacteriales bacterium]|nr:ATP-binding cassette domain-containing protein [Flavobacteriales bacterium]